MVESLVIIALNVLGGCIAGLLYAYIGGTGVTRKHTIQLEQINELISNVSTRLTQEIARRAAAASSEVRAQKKNIEEQARERLQTIQPAAYNPPVQVTPSFSTHFKKGNA
jgi:hypothetical protein